jgi:hypothetical protein
VRLAPLILALFLASGCRNVTGLSELGPPTLTMTYRDTDAGFSAFIDEPLNIHARSSDVQRHMRSLVIPNSSAWFIETFGPTIGPVFDFRYRHQLGWQFGRLYAFLPILARDQNVQVLWDHSVPESGFISLVNRPLKIYFAWLSNGDWAMKIGYFVYVEGSFRLFGYFDIAAHAEELHAEYDKPFEE